MTTDSLLIRNCPLTFRCTQKWSSLTVTIDPRIRFCEKCVNPVHFCESDSEIADALRNNKCIAMSLIAAKSSTAENDDIEDDDLFMGF